MLFDFHSCLLIAAIPSNVTIINSALTFNTVRLGSRTTLTCSTNGTGPLQYKWYHNSSAISHAIYSNYRTPRTRYSSAGVYTCVVSNYVGEDNGTYTLKVQGEKLDCTVKTPILCVNHCCYVEWVLSIDMVHVCCVLHQRNYVWDIDFLNHCIKHKQYHIM